MERYKIKFELNKEVYLIAIEANDEEEARIKIIETIESDVDILDIIKMENKLLNK